MSLVADPNILTKDLLKAELKRFNIPLPPPDAKKSVYVDLYRSELLENLERLEFSSDDEIEFTGSKRKKKPGSPTKRVIKSTKTMAEMLDISSLNDEELASRLQALGVDVGPILDTTRRVYQKKLEKLLSERKEVVPVKKLPPSEEFSDHTQDEEEEEEPEPEPPKPAPVKKSPARTSERLEYKRPPLNTRQTKTFVEPEQRGNQTFLNNSNLTHRVVTKETTTVKETVNNVTPKPYLDSNIVTRATTVPIKDTKKTPAKSGRKIPVWIQVCIFLIVAIVIFLIIQNMEPAKMNPFNNLLSAGQ